MTVAEAASVLAYRGGWRAVRYLPEAAAYALFRRGADLAWQRQTRGARRLRSNLARVVPDAPPAELDGLARDGLRSYFAYWCDEFRLPDWRPERVHRVQTIDEQVLRRALAQGHGVVGGLPHMGNWDHAGAWVVSTGVQVTTVAERLRPEAVYREFLEFREGLGMTIYPLDEDGDVADRLADSLAANHFVPLLADRDLTGRGVPVEFFGEPATMPAGPAVLALRTAAPLIAVATWYCGDPPDHRLVVAFDGPIEVPDGSPEQQVQHMTQQMAAIFESRVRAHPTDWHMLQRVFTADVTPR